MPGNIHENADNIKVLKERGIQGVRFMFYKHADVGIFTKFN